MWLLPSFWDGAEGNSGNSINSLSRKEHLLAVCPCNGDFAVASWKSHSRGDNVLVVRQ